MTSKEASEATVDLVDGPAALYRRYRPLRLADLVGQEPSVAALRSALSSGRVAHAYLFSGPRGTGKTTSARILAMALNCTDRDGVEPCGTCMSCLSIQNGSSMDVVELDAASNNGVDAVRDLIAKAAIGTPGNRKVYIVDEVHMLSNSASNALLKTLEEPPAHVVFVLATTDPAKVAATVRSRTQQLAFRLVRPDVLAGHLSWVAGDAGLDVSDAQVAEAVRLAKGSVRDALSALDVVVAAGLEPGVSPSAALVDAMVEADVCAALKAIAEAVTDGVEPRPLTEDALDVLRDMFLVQMGASTLVVAGDLGALEAKASSAGPKATVKMMDALGDAVVAMRADHEPRIALEVSVARYCKMAARQPAAA